MSPMKALLLTLWLAAEMSFSSLASSGPDTISPGLTNLGNTCYLNSQLECAFHIPKIRSLIESPPLEDAAAKDEDTADQVIENPDAEAAQPVESLALQALRRVFQSMEASSAPVAPRTLCHILGIPIMEQQDSQEFWKLLLPAIRLPALTDLYQGSFEDYIIANDGSEREKRREEPFLDLSLDVSSKNSIMEGLKNSFGDPEILSVAEGNGWRPEKGSDRVDALKGSLLRVQGLPCILQLHLKRFSYDWQNQQMSKLNDRCSFPEELDLSQICKGVEEDEKPAAAYLLQSIVVHAGEFGSGHYYAYVRPNVLSEDWYRFNDHVVTKVSLDEVFVDCYGGKTSICNTNNWPSKGLLQWFKSIFQPKEDPFGFGGRTSNAYVVQYVRRCEIPSLYLLDKTCNDFSI